MQSNVQQYYPSFCSFYESHFFPGQTPVPPRSGTWILDLSHDPIWAIWLAEVRKFHQHHDRIGYTLSSSLVSDAFHIYNEFPNVGKAMAWWCKYALIVWMCKNGAKLFKMWALVVPSECSTPPCFSGVMLVLSLWRALTYFQKGLLSPSSKALGIDLFINLFWPYRGPLWQHFWRLHIFSLLTLCVSIWLYQKGIFPTDALPKRLCHPWQVVTYCRAIPPIWLVAVAFGDKCCSTSHISSSSHGHVSTSVTVCKQGQTHQVHLIIY